MMRRFLRAIGIWLLAATIPLASAPAQLAPKQELPTPLPATMGGTGVNYGLAGAAIFGTGADGTVSITSGTTQISRDFHYANLTISGTGHLVPVNGHKIKVSGTLDLTACPAGGIFMDADTGSLIYNPTAGAAAGATGGSGGTGILADRTSVPINIVGVAGKTGGTGVGAAGAQGGASVNNMWGGRGGAAGAGGASGTPNAGGALAAQQAAANFGVNLSLLEIDALPLQWVSTAGLSTTSTGSGGAVGGAGGGDGVNAGGGSGGSGNGGGPLRIFANTLNRGASTAASCIAALGENAGASANGVAGTAGGGGGSSGGGGGWIHLVAGTLIGSTAANMLDVSGGSGAAGGNGLSTGKGGNGGDGGNCGVIDIINIGAGTYTHPITGDAQGGAGGTTANATGGTAGSGCNGKANL